ncbi:MAG TPA: hypothetical protein VMF57_21790 [Solirubrobacteraceae bacterium]|nr:hypothetical protein [Solirubrobacteraceae bacterium]
MINSTGSEGVSRASGSEPGRGASRRELLLAGGASALAAALVGAPAASARIGRSHGGTQEVLNVASQIEVLTTVVTTTALQKLGSQLPQAAIDTVGAASREELDHYEVLTRQFGGRAATHQIWVPDAVFASPTALFTTLVVGEQICIDLYLVATTIWAQSRSPYLARVGAELVGNEGVHRALARQALGLQPNDRAFMKYNQVDQADGPGNGTVGFTDPQGAITSFEAAGVGFGTMGATPGAFYDFDTVRQSTPNPSFVNTLEPH